MPALSNPRSSRVGGLGSSTGAGRPRRVPFSNAELAKAGVDPPLHPRGVPGTAEPLSVTLGVDASLTNTGLVALNLQGEVVATTNIRPKLKGVDRLLEIQDALDRFLCWHLVNASRIVHICMESYSFGSHFQAAPIGEGGGAIKMQLFKILGDPVGYPTLVTPSQLKKFVTGKGTAKKEVMLLYVYKKWGYETRDNNLADAYALARIALALHLDETSTQYERDVVDALHLHTERALPWTPSIPSDIPSPSRRRVIPELSS